MAGSPRETGHDGGEVGHGGKSLHPQGDLEDDLREVVGGLADRPGPVGALAPRRPVQGEVGPYPGRLLLPGSGIRGLPGHISQEHVDLEALFDRLALQEGVLERGALFG